MEINHINIYTDGACKGNPGKGGYGIILEVPNTNIRKEFSEGFRKTTNNRMELLAVIEALKKLKREGLFITIYSDSRYVVDAVEKRWLFNWEQKQFRDKKNPDLWSLFLHYYRKHHISFIWLKGHNQHPMNERCDFLACQASQGKTLQTDTFFEEEVMKNNQNPLFSSEEM